MPVATKTAQATVSELAVNRAQPSIKPAKPAKKRKTSTKVKSVCASVSRSLQHNDIPKEKQISTDAPRSADDEYVPSNGERLKTGVVRRSRPTFEETLRRLFGAYSKLKSTPDQRRRQLDGNHALYGPDGQTTMSDYYDVFEPYCDKRNRRHHQQREDKYSEVVGDNLSSRPTSSMSAAVSHKRLFGESADSESTRPTPNSSDYWDVFEPYCDKRNRRHHQQREDKYSEVVGDNLSSRPASSMSAAVSHKRLFGESADSESTRPTPNSSDYWDVFEPYRDWQRRPQKHKSDVADTQRELFEKNPAPTARKPVKNPPRFSKNTPKIVDDIVHKHLTPLIPGNDLPPPRTGKAFPKPNDPPRNPLTGAGYGPPFRNSIVVPDGARQLKAPADCATLTDPHDRNPVTGDGMPDTASITDPKGRKPLPSATGRSQLVISDDGASPSAASGSRLTKRTDGKRPFHAGTFTSQFVISDEPGPPSADGGDGTSKRHDGKRWSDAQFRIFGSPRNLIFSCAEDVVQSNKRTDVGSRTDRRRIQPSRDVPRQRVLAWSKANGNVDNDECYVRSSPMIPRAAARDSWVSPITGLAVDNRYTGDSSTSAAASKCGCRRGRKRVQPTSRKHRQYVLAWGKASGNGNEQGCYLGASPTIRCAADRHSCVSPITGLTAGGVEEQTVPRS